MDFWASLLASTPPVPAFLNLSAFLRSHCVQLPPPTHHGCLSQPTVSSGGQGIGQRQFWIPQVFSESAQREHR